MEQIKTDINDMLVFLAVVESGSFTLAANRLCIPKANVSRKVAKLEEQLGVRLLERTTRRQHLTEAGKRYVQHCKHIQQEIDLATASVLELSDAVVGRLRVGASVSVGQMLLQPVLGEFLKQHPQLDLQLNLVNRRVDLIEEGFDVLIRVGELDDSQLIAKPLGSAQRSLFASPNYVSQAERLRTIDELNQHPMLLMGSIHGRHQVELVSANQKRLFDCEPRLLADDFSVVRQAAIDGLGIAVIPDYMCQQAIERGELVKVLPEWGMSPVTFYALYPKHRLKIAKVKAFVDFVVGVFARRLAA